MKTSRRSRIWIALLVLFVLPLLVAVLGAVLGVLVVIPVKRRVGMKEQGVEPTIQVVALAAPTATPLAGLTASAATPTSTPKPASTPTSAPRPTPASTDAFALFLFDAPYPVILVIIPGIAGLVVLVGVVVVTPFVKQWTRSDTRSKDTNADEGGGKSARLRYVLLAFTFWLVLSVFLFMDYLFSASVYLRFTISYATFWVVVGALLLHGRPTRTKLLILGLFVVAVLSVHFIDWNSRKPFLRDFYRVRQGMAPAQVEQIMGEYMKWTSPAAEIDDSGQIVTGSVLYHHTTEAWGNVDVGLVSFEDARVVRKHFSLD